MGIIMQAWGMAVVTLAMLMVAAVDAKIYERCDLAMKLEKAGLNGFRGYSIGDCETPVAPSPTHTLSCPPHSDPGLPCNLSPPQARHDPLSHPLTDRDDWFN